MQQNFVVILGLAPEGSRCDDGKLCVNKKCVAIETLDISPSACKGTIQINNNLGNNRSLKDLKTLKRMKDKTFSYFWQYISFCAVHIMQISSCQSFLAIYTKNKCVLTVKTKPSGIKVSHNLTFD